LVRNLVRNLFSLAVLSFSPARKRNAASGAVIAKAGHPRRLWGPEILNECNRLFSSLNRRDDRIGCMKALCWILLLCTQCSAQELTVRVLNAKNRQPLAKQTVTVQYLNEKPPGASAPVTLKTDGHGEARFTVPSPLPATVNVMVHLTSEHWNCGCWVMAEAAKVLHDGVAGPLPSVNTKNVKNFKPEPTEVVILASPFTFWQRLLYPLEKE